MMSSLATDRTTQRWVTALVAEVSVLSHLLEPAVGARNATGNVELEPPPSPLISLGESLIAALSNCSPHFHICITT